MSKQRATAGKRQRELNKQAKAAAKRDRRQRLAEEAAAAPGDGDRSETPTGELLDLIEALHRQFEDGQISFEVFEQRKEELFARLQVD